MTPGKPLTHNMLSGASLAPPPPPPPHPKTNPLRSRLSLSGHCAWYLRRLSGCHTFSKCLVRDSLRLLSQQNSS